MTIRTVLENEGYDVMSACNGLDALEKLKAIKKAPALILLDLMMPLMTGEQFLEKRKDFPILSNVPVVAVTAQTQRLSQITVTDVIPKPINLKHLINTVERNFGISA